MTPVTLQDTIRYFSDPANCDRAMIQIRWPDGVVRCPTCNSDKVTYLPSGKVWRCAEKHPRRKFSLKVGTIFEDSPIGLDKWFTAGWLIANCKNGVSSYEIARDLGVTQKTAWFMLHRLRLAMQAGTFEKIAGTFEADETFIGGLARFMHKADRVRKISGTGGAGKFKRFQHFMRAIVAVPKAEIDKEETKWQQERAERKRKAAPKSR